MSASGPSGPLVLQLVDLTLCMLGNFSGVLSSADLFIFFKILFKKNGFRNTCTIRVSNSLDLDQTRHFFGPDLGSNCFQRLSADDSSKLRHGFQKGELSLEYGYYMQQHDCTQYFNYQSADLNQICMHITGL